MQSLFTAKEQLNSDTPLFLFDCTLSDGTVQRWSNRTIAWNGLSYDARVLRHNLFEAQLGSDAQVGGAPKLSFELANADSHLSEIERQTGFKGAQLTVRSVFFDLTAATATTDATVVFHGLINPPDSITESVFRLSALNRMSMQRTIVPEVRVQRMCPWRFPSNAAQRLIAIDGGPRGKYSPFFRCGYSPDQTNGVGNLHGSDPFTSCAYTRSDCQQRGMFTADSSGRPTARFGGIEYVPPTILVRGAGQKNSQLSAVQDNVARYNDFIPLIYGTQWHMPDVVFARNDGNLTRFEVLLGMGEIQGILKVLVNDIEIPRAVNGTNMTSTGWYSLITAGSRNGLQDGNFADAHGVPQGDPYGSMAYLSIVVPNRINDGTSIPAIQVLMQGLRLWQFDTDSNYLGEIFSSNPAWVLLDVLMRSGYTLDEIDTGSFARAAAYADELITVDDPVGGHTQIPRFQCQFALKNSRSAGEIIRSIRNGSRFYLVLNASGLIEARVEGTFALQQPQKAAGSNAQNSFSGGWPAYEFDAGSIARNSDGSAAFKMMTRAAQDTPNRLSIEFQDAFNQYQQDSLSLADDDDIELCGQEIAATWDAVGISTFNQAARMLLLALNRRIAGNVTIEFQTSVKALGLMPGDLITVTYQKENLHRAPFRITKIAPGANFRTATITAQFHDDDWYSDTVSGISGGLGRPGGQGSGIPAPIAGTIVDGNGTLQLGIVESEVSASDGSSNIELSISFTAPSGTTGTLPAPLIGLVPVVSSTGGTLPASTYYYALSTLDSDGGESPLSFVAQAAIPAGTSTNSVMIDGIMLPVGGVAFNVYRGLSPQALTRIASNQSAAPSFCDNGLAAQTILPPDPQFDHVNVNWRWELLTETSAPVHSTNTIGNPTLQLKPNQFQSALVRLTRGTGFGQERTILGNTSTTLNIDRPWSPEPDATSYFVIAENAWRFGAKGATSPISIDVPERIGAGLEVSARAANATDEEAALELSPLTRWVLGQSGGLSADSDVPPSPSFGVSVARTGGGVLDLTAIGFTSLTNTRSIVAGTYKFYYYDEVNGGAPYAITNAIAPADVILPAGGAFAAGTLLQIDQELIIITDKNPDGTFQLQRGAIGTTAAAHPPAALAYTLTDKVVIVPFVKSFFGTPASGNWKSSVSLPNVRLAAAELFMTNALGDGAVTANSYTGTVDSGLRTMAGGQFSFQVSGYLCLQNNAAPVIVVDTNRSVLDIFALVGTPPCGSPLNLQLNRNGAPYAALQCASGATISNVVSGFGLPALRSGDQLSFDITGVGSVVPGSDLSVILRL